MAETCFLRKFHTLWIGSFLYFSKVALEGLCKVYPGIWQGAVCVSCTEVVPNLDSIIFHWRNFMLYKCKWEDHYRQTHCWDKDHNRLLWVLDHIKDLLVTARHWYGIRPISQMSLNHLKVETSTISIVLFVSSHFATCVWGKFIS